MYDVVAGRREQLMSVLNVEVTLTTMDCVVCGGTYALNEAYRAKREQDGQSWHCPYCDKSIGYHESETKRLTKELAAEKARHDQTRAALADEQRQLVRERKAAKRLKTRASKGVCPCCNRYFVKLHRHMETKHPEYTESHA